MNGKKTLCLLFLIFLGGSVWLLPTHAQKKRPLTYAEKKKIAKQMKKIAKALGVKCKYCHLEAKKGLRAGDFTLLTDDGKFAHDVMFPLSKKFMVSCDFCHNGKDELTPAGERAEKDFDHIDRVFKRTGKKLTCTSCHIPPKKALKNPFLKFLKGVQ